MYTLKAYFYFIRNLFVFGKWLSRNSRDMNVGHIISKRLSSQFAYQINIKNNNRCE